jgi:serine/threonine protein kinase
MAVGTTHSVPEMPTAPEQRSATDKCPRCGKPSSSAARQGSITAWLFQSTYCLCPRNGAVDNTPANAATALTLRTLGAKDLAPSAPATAQPMQLPELADRVKEQFEFISELGRGGMGTVYLVRERESGTLYAIKLVNQDLVNDPRCIKQFELETQAVKNLNHGNLVAVHESGLSLKGVPWILMDYIQGKDLGSIIRQQGHLPVDDGLVILLQICDGLQYAHGKGIVHRDLKPSNVIITAGKKNFVKIVDFGIAKILSPFENKDKTSQTEEVVGTPNYMSPEQCQGEQLDARSDIYSFGCVMYEVFSGSPPFTHKNQIKTILDHIRTKPKPLATRFPSLQIPAPLDAVILKCLSKKPPARYQTAKQLNEDLNLIANGKSPQHARPRLAIAGWVPLTAGAIVCAAILGTVVFMMMTVREVPKPAVPSAKGPAYDPSLGDNDAIYKITNDVKEKDEVTMLIEAHTDFTESFAVHHSGKARKIVPISQADLARLSKKMETTSVGLRMTDIHDSDIRYLYPLSVQKVDLSGCPNLTPSIGEQLSQLTKLHYLDLSDDRITTQTLKDISNLKITDLLLSGTTLSDLDPITSFKTLRTLNLETCEHLTDESFGTLAKLPNLNILYIGNTDLNSARMHSLAQISSLKLLSVPFCRLTDEQLVELLACPGLVRLNVDVSEITDKGLRTLAKMPMLQEVDVQGCKKITAEGMADFRKAKPNCDLYAGQIEARKYRDTSLFKPHPTKPK